MPSRLERREQIRSTDISPKAISKFGTDAEPHRPRNVMEKECKKEVGLRQKGKIPSLRKRRKGITVVESGLLKEEALKEARRCLSLRECESCEICELLCPDLCITRDEKTGEVLIDLDYCKGCGICASICPKGAIQMVLEEVT